jgi:hypothetical protein
MDNFPQILIFTVIHDQPNIPIEISFVINRLTVQRDKIWLIEVCRLQVLSGCIRDLSSLSNLVEVETLILFTSFREGLLINFGDSKIFFTSRRCSYIVTTVGTETDIPTQMYDLTCNGIGYLITTDVMYTVYEPSISQQHFPK